MDILPARNFAAIIQYLNFRELHFLRSTNRLFYYAIAEHTKDITITDWKNAHEYLYVPQYFHRVTTATINYTVMTSLEETFLPIFTSWKYLTSVHLHSVMFLEDKHLLNLSLNCRKLKYLEIQSCYLLRWPCFLSTSLEVISIQQCMITKLHPNTRCSKLKSLQISSHFLQSAPLIEILPRFKRTAQKLYLNDCIDMTEFALSREQISSPFEKLTIINLQNCDSLEVLWIEESLLPCLKTLSVSGCTQLQEVSICCESKNLTCLDFSFLVHLRLLALRIPSLLSLSIQSCHMLSSTGLKIELPKLQHCNKEGTLVGDIFALQLYKFS